jgi:hypothetical protein
MITGELKSKVDRIWDTMWSGGISNPLSVIEQLTYLLFIKRLDEIEKRVQEEGREEAEIERRMRASIRRSLDAGEVTEQQVRDRSKAPLFKKNFFERLNFLNPEMARIEYLGSYSMPSHSIHGSWHDLFRNHLYETDGGFMPDTDWVLPQAEYVVVPSLIALDAVEAFAATQRFTGRFEEALRALIDSLRHRSLALLVELEGYRARTTAGG